MAKTIAIDVQMVNTTTRNGSINQFSETGAVSDSDLDYRELEEDEQNSDPDDIYSALEGIDEYLFDFDEDVERDELQDHVITTGVISRDRRAKQEAIEIAVRYVWTDEGVELLAEIFEKYGWHTAKKAILRELDKGMNEEELRLALLTRECWQEYGEFGVNPFGYNYPLLSWPHALKIVIAILKSLLDATFWIFSQSCFP